MSALPIKHVGPLAFHGSPVEMWRRQRELRRSRRALARSVRGFMAVR